MPNLRTLSGKEIIDIFQKFDFQIVGQKGSHIKLQRILPDNIRQTLVIPNHKEIDKGTSKAIYRQALRYISEDKLNSYFYL